MSAPRILVGAAALIAALAAAGDEPRTASQGADADAPAGAAAPAAEAGFTPSETISADTAVAFPVDI